MKKRCLFILNFFLLSQISFGQSAPDFTITGTDGNIHELYADYLNQGKTVMFEIMFTNCPPCNSFAGNLEPLYQTWGEGAEEVQFFSLSNKGYDSNMDVHSWELGHGLTFPGAGEDGGALVVVEDYTDGTFGPFFGTPFFVVIAPNGAVTWNVGSGLSGSAKVQALHDAIAATGAMLPFGGIFFKGSIETPDGNLVKNVDLGISQIEDSIGVSDELGLFEFEYPLAENETYTFSALKDENYENGVSTYDLVLIAKHILNVELFTNPYQLIAADINNSGSITTIDLVVMRKVILGIDDNFFNNTSWRFQLEDCNFNNCGLDDLFDFTTENDLDSLNIIAIKIGDVNFSANGQNLQSPDDRNLEEGLIFRLENRYLEKGSSIRIPFQAVNSHPILGFQFALEFNPDYLLFDYFENGNSIQNLNISTENFNFQKAEEGLILSSWHDVNGQNLGENPIFYLNFKVKKAAYLRDIFEISSTEIEAESYDDQGNIKTVAFEYFELINDFKVFPNPAHDFAEVHWNANFYPPTKIRLIDISGKTLNHINLSPHDQAIGNLQLDFSKFGGGIYLIEIENNHGELVTRKVVKH